MKALMVMLLIAIPLCMSSQSLGKKRVDRLKSSVVQIVLNGQGVGTGFFINEDGLLLTCWHVFDKARYFDTIEKMITYNIGSIYAKFANGDTAHLVLQYMPYEKNDYKYMLYDYAILKINEPIKFKIKPIKLGNFNRIIESDLIYTSGYPAHCNDLQIITTGIISSKSISEKNMYKRQGFYKDTIIEINQAYMNLTSNFGNSGGPIIKLGKSYKDDEIIGIANFIVSPYHDNIQQLDFSLLDTSKLNVNYYLKTIINSISNSVSGISGCTSIEYALSSLKRSKM